MKQKFLGWSQRYVAALRNDLKPGRCKATPDGVAARLGREAVTLGLKTLDLAQIHWHALNTLVPSTSLAALIARAEAFFSIVHAPTEETHGVARWTTAQVSWLKKTLGRRTQELADTNQQLRRGVIRRKVLEHARVESDTHYQKCLAESLQLQNLLRQLTHRVLAAQEDERLKISHELQDEIVQTLVGIQVRLLTLKHEARGNAKHLKNQIAKAQQMVVNSAKSVRQFARKLNTPPPTLSDRSPATL